MLWYFSRYGPSVPLHMCVTALSSRHAAMEGSKRRPFVSAQPTPIRSRYDGQIGNRSISHQGGWHRAVRKEEGRKRFRGRTGDDVDTGLAHRRHTLRLFQNALAQNHRQKNAADMES